jgi:hypothetical protein
VDDSEYVNRNNSAKHTQSEYAELVKAVAGLAARQQGVIARRQLLQLGLGRNQIEHLLANHRLHPLHRAVYAVGHTRLVPDAHLRAALLACGPAAFLSHRTAAAVLGLRPLSLRAIEVTIPGPKVNRRRGLIVHRTVSVPHPHELRRERDLRISSVPRLLIELAAVESQQELERLIVESNRRHLLHPDRAAAALERHRRRPGVGRLSRALAGYMRGPDRKSGLERAFDRLLARTPDIPQPQRNLRWGIWELDCYWPEQRVALELDGRNYHDALANMERDRFKDAKLLAAGIRPMRVTDRRFEADSEGVLADLRAVLCLRPAA